MAVDAVLLAAGFGTRLRPLTLHEPKPALPFLNRPMVHWTLDRLTEAGVRRVLVNLHHLPRAVEAAVRSHGGRMDAVFSMEPDIRGTAGVFWALRGEIRSDPFLVVNGDVHFRVDLLPLLLDLEVHPEARVSLGVMPLPPGAPHTPLEVAGDGRLLAFGRGKHFFAGIYAARRALLGGLSGPEFRELVPDLLLPLLGEGRVRCCPLEGRWHDLGSPGAYLRATFELLEDAREVPENLLVERSGFPCLLDASAEISKEALLSGPLVAGPGCRADPGAVLGETVLLEGSRVRSGERAVRAIVHRRCRLRA